ncbi:immunity-related GTPase family M protein 1 isoform X1 [Cricetulus griseus]|uniref:Immunity-related GTPase family M protein 1 isoform X1 n=2 Tax=Cricetulus griseus TaxID=10029 RepID=A0A9J7JZ68_CRIGR|nr:immunity-related GTPase family M protein 1 isoform X1 [Cricetulus griseus]XP_035303903.1 immunity-related GTPase family M protein 1 isoform X1 [Cricetulus griseus]
MPACRVAPLLTNMEEAVGSPKDKQPTCFSDFVFIGKDSNILTVEVINKIEKAVKGKDWVELVSIVKDIKKKISITTVKIAVTGDSGNGLSSFINTLRLIGHEEEDSAPIGVVRTTQEPAPYFSSEFPNVELWDLPGTGVTSQSMENYLHEMGFDNYDLIIIIASEQFSSNHVKLAKAMQRMRRRFYVVWTKLDRDLSSSPLSEPQLLQSIQKNIWESLQKEGVKEPPIFLVSSMEPLAYGFPELRKMLQDDISNSRNDSLLETFFLICEKTINDKVESIKMCIEADNLRNDFEISDPDNLGECQKVFQEKFGVDDKSLHQLALIMGQPEAYYIDAKQSQVIRMYPHGDSTLSWLYHSGAQVFFKNFDSVYCCFNHNHHRHKQQKCVLEDVAEETKKILRKIVKDTIILP